jgi:hypothetical protein
LRPAQILLGGLLRSIDVHDPVEPALGLLRLIKWLHVWIGHIGIVPIYSAAELPSRLLNGLDNACHLTNVLSF